MESQIRRPAPFQPLTELEEGVDKNAQSVSELVKVKHMRPFKIFRNDAKASAQSDSVSNEDDSHHSMDKLLEEINVTRMNGSNETLLRQSGDRNSSKNGSKAFPFLNFGKIFNGKSLHTDLQTGKDFFEERNNSEPFNVTREKLRSLEVGKVEVRMQNTSLTRDGETRLIYSVHLGGEPVPAASAARDMALLSEQEVALELGAPVIIQSERKLNRLPGVTRLSHTSPAEFAGNETFKTIYFQLILKKRGHLPYRVRGTHG